MSKSGRHVPIRAAVRTVPGMAALSASAAAFSQQASESGSEQDSTMEEVVVTGFEESLSPALDQKRDAVGAIVAEDIADFPDLNHAVDSYTCELRTQAAFAGPMLNYQLSPAWATALIVPWLAGPMFW